MQVGGCGGLLRVTTLVPCVVLAGRGHALAQDADIADVVLLPGGGRVRGIVTEYEPGARAVLRTPSGELRTWTAGADRRRALRETAPSS